MDGNWLIMGTLPSFASVQLGLPQPLKSNKMQQSLLREAFWHLISELRGQVAPDLNGKHVTGILIRPNSDFGNKGKGSNVRHAKRGACISARKQQSQTKKMSQTLS